MLNRAAGAVANAELRQVLPKPDSITLGELDRANLSVAANGRKRQIAAKQAALSAQDGARGLVECCSIDIPASNDQNIVAMGLA